MDQTWARQSLRIPYSLKPFLKDAPNRSEAIIEALKAYYGVDGGGGQEYLFQRIAAIEVHLGIEPPPAPEPPPIEVPPAKPKKKRKAKAKKSPAPAVEENPPGASASDTITSASTPLDGQDIPAPAEVEEPASEEIPPPPPAEDTPGEEPASDEISPPAEVEPDTPDSEEIPPAPAAKTGQIKWDIFLQDFPDKTIANLEELTTIACERYPDKKPLSLREALRTKLKKLAKRK